jgi:transcriptional regulator with GAF, ATPase, and Fis domain
MIRSELFGAEAGAFTGAIRRITGAVERASGGTLFLDEIGDLPAEVQPMLLRFLDRQEFERLGQYGRVQRADVRIVAATNSDLRLAARQGIFRADLWFRLSVRVIEVPPLRDRWEDIAGYLANVRLPSGRSMYDAFTKEARDLLRLHPWDGNFRELANFVERLGDCESVDATLCADALRRGALTIASVKPAEPPDLSSESGDWSQFAARAMKAFVEERGATPRTWDEQKEYTEKFLKPLVFFHLSGCASQSAPPDDEALGKLASQAAGRLQADRGTAVKQLARYFDVYSR